MKLHDALGGMRSIPQFFLWRLTWNEAEGKYNKMPCSPGGTPLQGEGNGASAPHNWMTYTAAVNAQAALPTTEQTKYALGFWLTADTGYWFFDIDKAVIASGLHPFASDLVARTFPGVLVEWSSSGKGLHLIGRAPQIPTHRSKPPREIAAQLKPMELEFYTDGRGIAFGLSGEANGSADTVCDVGPLCAAYFPPRPEIEAGVRPEWRGPADDAVLIERMLHARISAAAAFGGKASLPQLWAGQASHDSESDMALCAHLAFWTGCDEDRMRRLALMSGLKRDKWFERRVDTDYLGFTIRNAAAGTNNVYQEPARTLTVPQTPVDTNVRNGAALMQRVFPPVQWALRDLIPQGTAILSAAPKAGKSFLVLQACIAIAAGVPLWQGRQPEEQGETLYLDLEGNDRRLQERIAGLLKSYPADIRLDGFFYETNWARADAGVQQLREWLLEHPKCRLVVIDTLATWRDPDPGRASAYSADYAVGAGLKPLARDFPGVAFLMVSHTRKQSGGDAIDRISGTFGLVGSFDNYLILSRKGEDGELVVNGRDIREPQELALRGRKDGGWTCIGKSVDIKRSSERRDVLTALESLGGVGMPKDIRAALEDCVTPGTLHTRLSRMVKAGEIRKDGKFYTLISARRDGLSPPPLPSVAM